MVLCEEELKFVLDPGMWLVEKECGSLVTNTNCSLEAPPRDLVIAWVKAMKFLLYF